MEPKTARQATDLSAAVPRTTAENWTLPPALTEFEAAETVTEVTEVPEGEVADGAELVAAGFAAIPLLQAEVQRAVAKRAKQNGSGEPLCVREECILECDLLFLLSCWF